MIATVVLLFFCSGNKAHGYVYLAPQRPRIVPEDGRTQVFYLTSQAPVFKDKETFEGGSYAGYSDDETFALLVERAMNYWNEIEGLSLQLAVGEERKGVIDSDDNLFSIGIAKISTVASGLAYPATDDQNLRRLRDCDIQIGTDIESIPSFIFVMVHELGHCLGLGHNHSDPAAIMSYWQPRSIVALSLDDIAGVLSLYPPDSSEKPVTFAPCGSVAGAMSSGSTLASSLGTGSTRRTHITQIALTISPLLWVFLSAFTSWSCRRRRQSSGR
jgi:hypothetical protein